MIDTTILNDDQMETLETVFQDDTINAALIEIASNGEITITSSAENDEEFLAILTVIQDAIPQYIKELVQ